MPDYSIIRLEHMSPMHIGCGRESLEFSLSELSSDSVNAALASMRAREGRISDLKNFIGSFLLSSTFPYWDNHYFLPIMAGERRLAIKGQEEFEHRKTLKKLRYAEYPLWKKLIAAEKCTIEMDQIQEGAYLFADSKTDAVFTSLSKDCVSERVSVPKDGVSESIPFFFEWKYFDRKAGLYVLTDARGPLLEELMSLFTKLGEEGIGTDRGVGGGKFEVSLGEEPLHLDEPEGADGVMILSTLIPTRDDLSHADLSNSRYSIVRRFGYMAGSSVEEFRHLRRKSIFMFGTGSVFSSKKHFEGKVVELTPDWNSSGMHPVFRSGKPLCCSIKF